LLAEQSFNRITFLLNVLVLSILCQEAEIDSLGQLPMYCLLAVLSL